MNSVPPWLWRYHKKLALSISRIFFSSSLNHPVRAWTEFKALQAYQPGDPIRNIDRKTTAKKNSPYSKQTQEKDVWVWLLIDEKTRNRQKKRNTIDQLSYSIAYAMLKQGEKVGIVSQKWTIPLSSRSSILQKLQLMMQDDAPKKLWWNLQSLVFGEPQIQEISWIEMQINQILRKGIKWRVIVILSESVSVDKKTIAALSTNNTLIWISCFDPDELTSWGAVLLWYDLNWWSILIKNSSAWRDVYDKKIQQTIRLLGSVVQSWWWKHCIIYTDEEVLPSLLSQIS